MGVLFYLNPVLTMYFRWGFWLTKLHSIFWSLPPRSSDPSPSSPLPRPLRRFPQMGPALTTLGGRGVTPRKMLCYAPTEVSSTPDSPQNQCGPYFKINVTFTRTSRILSSMNLSARLFSIENLHLNVFGNIFLNKVTPQIRKIVPPAAANILLIKIFQNRPESSKIDRVPPLCFSTSIWLK